jgi:hypothetical protein
MAASAADSRLPAVEGDGGQATVRQAPAGEKATRLTAARPSSRRGRDINGLHGSVWLRAECGRENAGPNPLGAVGKASGLVGAFPPAARCRCGVEAAWSRSANRPRGWMMTLHRRALLGTALALPFLRAIRAEEAPPPILFVHGNGDHAALWLTTLWRFEANGWPRERLWP